MNKKQIAVQKRKATILKKRQLKKKKKLETESKKLLNAGFMFINEKNNVSDNVVNLMVDKQSKIDEAKNTSVSNKSDVGSFSFPKSGNPQNGIELISYCGYFVNNSLVLSWFKIFTSCFVFSLIPSIDPYCLIYLNDVSIPTFGIFLL